MSLFHQNTLNRVTVVVALLLSACARGEDLLVIDFSSDPPDEERVYASKADSPWGSLTVAAGGTVTLSVERGRDYELRAGGWRWTQVQEVPVSVDAVQVTPSVDQNTVRLDVMLYRQERDERRRYRSTVSGSVGQWLLLYGPSTRPGARVYGTGGSIGGTPRLFVRVAVADNSR